MAEILEYALVVMVGSFFVAGSVAVYSGFSSAESGASVRAAYDEVYWLASRAVENGSAGAVLLLPPSTISCNGGVLTVGVGASAENGTVPAGCGFSVALDGGTHLLRFTDSASELDLEVG